MLSAVVSGGFIRLSNLVDPDMTWTDLSFDFGVPANSLPIGTIISARIRINSNTRRYGYADYVYADTGYTDMLNETIPNNKWVTIYFPVTSQPFSQFTFEPGWDDGTWDNANDSIDIDWIRAQPNDIVWGAWGPDCTTATCTPTQSFAGKTHFQYQYEMTSSSLSNSPSLQSVQLNGTGAYEPSGIWSSPIIDALQSVDWSSFTTDETNSANTSVDYEFRSGPTATPDGTWEAWTSTLSVGGQINRYGQIRSTLSTNDSSETAVVHSIAVTYNQVIDPSPPPGPIPPVPVSPSPSPSTSPAATGDPTASPSSSPIPGRLPQTGSEPSLPTLPLAIIILGGAVLASPRKRRT